MSETATSPLENKAKPNGAAMLNWLTLGVKLDKVFCPRTRLAVCAVPGVCVNGEGNLTARPLPVSATHRLPFLSTARPEGRYSPVAVGCAARTLFGLFTRICR